MPLKSERHFTIRILLVSYCGAGTGRIAIRCIAGTGAAAGGVLRAGNVTRTSVLGIAVTYRDSISV